jgi:hypothetical protein
VAWVPNVHACTSTQVAFSTPAVLARGAVVRRCL